MAVTDKKKGVWGLDQVYNKINQGSIWSFQEPATLWSWGTNNYGQVGVNSSDEISSPTQIGSLTTWRYASGATGGGGGCFAINESNELYAWGNNTSGQLGQGNSDKRSSPVQIPGTTWETVSNSYGEGVGAIKTDGTLWTWGSSEYGEGGRNNRTASASPIQVPGTTWSSICGALTNDKSFLATKTDGTLWSWGSNTQGQLGMNNHNPGYSSPVQVGSATDWANGQDKLAVFNQSSMAIKTDGTLWALGQGSEGILAQNSHTQYSSPVQIPGTTWSSISAIKQSAIALKTDGTVWVWGRNDNGDLGQNNRTYRSSPVQVPGTWDSIQIQGGWSAGMYAIKSDKTLWSWGYNAQGGLGQNHATQELSSPTQIPGTWNKVVGKVYGAIAFKAI